MEALLVDKNIQSAESFDRLVDDALAFELAFQQVAGNQDALAALFFDQALGFLGVDLFFGQKCDCNVGAFLAVEDRNATPDPGIAASDESLFVHQLAGLCAILCLMHRRDCYRTLLTALYVSSPSSLGFSNLSGIGFVSMSASRPARRPFCDVSCGGCGIDFCSLDSMLVVG